ncbi:MAG: HAMP domain-containing protein [Desulfobulbaceae bacterium]|nr:HAMP domain-containing protein [Desulfobulbaceae bacterium]
MRFSALASIRVNLILLVLVAVLPALAILLFSGYALRETMVRSAESNALRQVQAMAAHHERVAENARLLLATLTRAREVQNLDAQACQQLLEEMRSGNTAYAVLSLADAEGAIVAASGPVSAADINDEELFHRATRQMEFVMGSYHLVPETRHVVIDFAQPVPDQHGKLLGVLMASFDLNYFGQIFADAHLPAGSVFTLTDAEGMRLTRFPETEKYTWVPDLPQMIAHMSGTEDEGTFFDTGVDGVRRLYSFKRLSFAETLLQHLMIRLGQPEDLALAEARQAERRNSALMVLATIMAVAAAWFVGEFAILRRMKQLMAAADRLGTGDLSTRTGLSHDGGELGRLAASFDRMAESLQIQDRDRQLAEEEVITLNKELEDRVVRRTAQLAEANTELQLTLEDLRTAQNQLVMSEKLAALGGLVAGVAHEINTPVGVALSAASTMIDKNRHISELFSQGEMKRSDLNEYLATTREGMELGLLNLHRASDLIRSFKMVASDQISETRRRFKVREYIEEILLSLRPKLKKTSHRVEVICSEELEIESYPGAFSQILTNLIVNSLTHAFSDGQSGLIRIEITTDGEELGLNYSDDGRGIPPGEQEKIFEPFYTTNRAGGSTGLGLHILFNIITNTLHGTISCNSSPGQGAVFQVRIPLHQDQA